MINSGTRKGIRRWTLRNAERNQVKIRVRETSLVLNRPKHAGFCWPAVAKSNETAALANKIAISDVYQQMTSEWRDHLKTFID
jgi:hypothetical protein